MSRYFFYALLYIGGLAGSAKAQTCSNLGQTPPTAFPVCGTTVFTQNSVPLCGSRAIPVNCFDGALYQDRNPYWYKFTCYVSGTLGFVITPQVLSDDYDWQLFDVTNKNPNDVFTDPSLFVSANWSFMSGTTGASTSGTGILGCAANTFTFCQMPTLIAGHQYLLLVSHFTNTQSGYQLSFGGGTASITDPNVPTITSATPACDGKTIVVRFNKALQCSSLTGSGSDFSVSPGATIVSALGHGCSAGFSIDSVTLTLSAALAAGTYTLTAAIGTDGNTLTDNCGLTIPTTSNVSFTILPQPAIPISTIIEPNTCTPVSMSLNFPEPIQCNSIAANGSDFIITGPSAVSITAANATCNANGETNTITIQFNGPILIPGNYQVQVVSGADGNTLTGPCNRVVDPGTNASFNIASQPAIPMGTVAAVTCSPSSLTINFNDAITCNSIAANGSDFLISGPSTASISSAIANCNANGETNTIILQLATPIFTSGNYQVNITTGTDGNTLLGACFRQVVAGEMTPFSIPVIPPVDMTATGPIGCSPSSITLNLSGPVQCASIAADGSDFSIAGLGPVSIIGASANCTNGLTSSIEIQLASPITVGGIYQIRLLNGSDGNTLLSDCNRPSPLSTISFMASNPLSADFNYEIQSDCNSHTVTFSHPGGSGVNNWNWTINGSSVGNQSSITRIFPAGSQQTVGLTISNGSCQATKTVLINLEDKVTVDFELPDFICPEDSLIITNLSTGPIDNWIWNFGNGQTGDTQHPLPQQYPVTGRESFYTITLRASNNTGCSDNKSKTLRVLATCLVAVPTAFTPNNDGLNDYLYPLNAFTVDELDFKIYNRWGECVFSSHDWQKKWDGKIKGVAQGSGVFAWTLSYKDKRSGQRHFLKGTSVLIR